MDIDDEKMVPERINTRRSNANGNARAQGAAEQQQQEGDSEEEEFSEEEEDPVPPEDRLFFNMTRVCELL